DLTATLLHRSQRPLSYWILATFLLCLACSSRRIAREVGIHIRTSYRWYWWLRNAALLMRWSANWRARSKRMISITRRATKGKPNRAGRRYGGADRVGVVRSASRAGAMMTKTVRRSSRGSAVRVPLWVVSL